MRLLIHALDLSPDEAAAFEASVARRGGGARAPSPLESQSPSRQGSAVHGRDGGLPPLVGRVRELAVLDRHLTGQGPPLVMLAGEPGIGKTRLLQETMRRAATQGWTVVHGGCHRHVGQEPYAPLPDALARCLRARPERQEADLRDCAWLVRLLPELTGGPITPLAASQLAAEQERRLVYMAVERFLANVAEPAGTLLVLDDLQWAGPDALDLLAALVRSAVDTPLRVVGAYRDTEVHRDTPLSAVLADLAAAGLAVRCALPSLSPDEMERLLGHLLEQAGGDRSLLHERLAHRLGGIPFFLVSYVQELQSGGLEHAHGVPWTLTQSLRQRVAALPVAGQEVVAATAVLGRDAARSLLQAMVARPDDEMVVALDAACQARLLEEAGREAYRFPHDVIREAIEASLSAARRTSLHRRVAAALEAQPAAARVESLAYHYEQGEAWDKALTYLLQAGDRATAAHAGKAAADYYARAYAASVRLGDAGLPAALDVARRRGFAHLDLGEAAEAMLAFTEMGEAALRLGDLRLYGMAEAYRSQAGAETHRFTQAEQALRAALPVDEEGFTDVAIAANLWLVSNLISQNHYLVNTALPLRTALALGWIFGEVQDHERAVGLLTQSLQATAQQITRDPEQEQRARLTLGDSLLALGRLDEAEQQFGLVDAAERQSQDPYELWHNRQHLVHSYGELWLARRAYEMALGYANDCVALAAAADTTNRGKAHRLRGQVLLAQGRLAEAAQDLDVALTTARQAENKPLLWTTLAAYGDLLWAQDRGQDACQAYGEALQIIDAIAAALDDAVLCETFLASAPVERLRRQARRRDQAAASHVAR